MDGKGVYAEPSLKMFDLSLHACVYTFACTGGAHVHTQGCAK